MINATSELQTYKIQNFSILKAVTQSGQEFEPLSKFLSVQKTQSSTMTSSRVFCTYKNLSVKLLRALARYFLSLTLWQQPAPMVINQVAVEEPN
ncbi:hypothetical protein NIES4073_58190 [Kalymmatonema gypsitolerans NIES-4073]|nr:hypothetical protein NIES4073_58190 [Scytonema sp. NIES-4073]